MTCVTQRRESWLCDAGKDSLGVESESLPMELVGVRESMSEAGAHMA